MAQSQFSKITWPRYWLGVALLCAFSAIAGEVANLKPQADALERILFYASKPLAAVLFGGGLVYVFHKGIERTRKAGLKNSAATAWWWTLGLQFFAFAASPEVQKLFSMI